LIETEQVYIALLHHPVYNKSGEVVASAITNLDLHDLARMTVTFGLKRYYVVTPLELQRKLAQRLMMHWLSGPGADYNWTRNEAFQRVRIIEDLEAVKKEISAESKAAARLIATSARGVGNQISFSELKK